MSRISSGGPGEHGRRPGRRGLAGGNAVEITTPSTPISRALSPPTAVRARRRSPRRLPTTRMSSRRSTPCSRTFWRLARPRTALWTCFAGADAQTKARVSAFVESLGRRLWDTAALFMARALENVGLLELGLMSHSVKHANFPLGITLLG